MVDVSAVALSGFAASQRRLAVAADNVANANTIGFKAKDVEQTALDTGGVSTRVVERTPATVPQVTEDGVVDAPNVSLERELVESNLATYSAQANLVALKTQKELDKTLLDIQA